MLRNVDITSVDKLVKKLQSNVAWLGGNRHCYSIEKKTRVFVDTVLMFVFKNFQCLESDQQIIRTDMEVELKIFGEIVKPDY